MFKKLLLAGAMLVANAAETLNKVQLAVVHAVQVKLGKMQAETPKPDDKKPGKLPVGCRRISEP